MRPRPHGVDVALAANFGRTAFTYAVPSGYSSGFGTGLTVSYPWLRTSSTNQLSTSGRTSIVSVTTTQSTPASTTVKYLVSLDGRANWGYWNGTAWTVASGGTTNLRK